VQADYFDINGWKIAEGEGFDAQDYSGAAKEVILGETVRRELFGEDSGIGQTVRIGRTPFTVIGTRPASRSPRGCSSATTRRARRRSWIRSKPCANRRSASQARCLSPRIGKAAGKGFAPKGRSYKGKRLGYPWCFAARSPPCA
jgi:hypothetical protein